MGRSKPLDSLGAWLKEGYDMRVRCENCQHEAIWDTAELIDVCLYRRWSRKIEDVERRMKCTNCGSRKAACFAHEREDRPLPAWVRNRS